ncbi:MAG: DUF481 domain-containing protein [Francisellaceae bacterium]
MRRLSAGLVMAAGCFYLAYGQNSSQFQEMAARYRALAQSYNQLADAYEKQAAEQKQDAATTIPLMPSAESGSNKNEKLTTSQSSELAKTAELPVQQSPWQQAVSQVDDLNKSLPTGLDEDYTVKKPDLTVVEPWKGTKFGLGGSKSTGNSASTNYNVNTSITYNPIVPWKSTLSLTYLYNRDDTDDGDGVQTNKLTSQAQTSWNFDKNNGVYGRINYTHDQLGSYEYTLSESVGYLRQLYNANNMTLDATFGPSLQQQKVSDSGEFSNAFGAQSGLTYNWNITDYASFSQSLLINYTPNDATTYETNTSLSSQIYDNFVLQLSFAVNGSSWASSDKKRVDTTTTTSIIYTF